MDKATQIFEKHWKKATGKPLDEATKSIMQYAIDAVNEALGIDEDSEFAIEWYKVNKLEAVKWLMSKKGKGLKETNDFLQLNQK